MKLQHYNGLQKIPLWLFMHSWFTRSEHGVIELKVMEVKGNDCVKSVPIRSFSGPYFPAFGLNMGRYSSSFRIQSGCRKNGSEKLRIQTLFIQCNILKLLCITWIILALLLAVKDVHQLFKTKTAPRFLFFAWSLQYSFKVEQCQSLWKNLN